MKRLSSTRRRLAPIPPILISSSARLSVTVISGPLRGIDGGITAGLGRDVRRGLAAGVGRCPAALLGRGPQDGLDDVLVAGAAAQVARQREAHLVLGRVVVAVEQRAGGQHHPRRAEAALQAVLLLDALLDGVQLAGGAGPLAARGGV